MLTRDDLIDLLVAGLAKAGPAPLASPAAAAAPSPKGLQALNGRVFLSEYEIKKRLTAGGNRLTIPKQSILSPLALDWLTLQGIEIVRE
jgi:hypothetical protein